MDHMLRQRTSLAISHHSAAAGSAPAQRGYNYALWAGISGSVDSETGTLVDRAALAAALDDVNAQFDHRDANSVLNQESVSQADLAHAVRHRLARQLPAPLRLDVLDLIQRRGPGTRLTDKAVWHIERGEFSAAHRTHAPRLSAQENTELYGICNNPAGHGHNYRVARLLPAESPSHWKPWAYLDHRNLSTDIAELQGRNVVTEAIAELIWRREPAAASVRVWETESFFAEYGADGVYKLGRRHSFGALHRLYNPDWSPEQNLAHYGKCGLPGQHGHTWDVWVIVASELDGLTESAYDLAALDALAIKVLAPLNGCDLSASLAPAVSTGEHMARYLWDRFEGGLGAKLDALIVSDSPDREYWVRRGIDGSPKH